MDRSLHRGVRGPSPGFAAHPWTSVLTFLGLSFPRYKMTKMDLKISKIPLAPTDLGLAPRCARLVLSSGWVSGEVGGLVFHFQSQSP